MVNVSLSGGDDRLVVKVLTSGTVRLEPGQDVWLVLDERKLHFFDKRTGLRVIL